MYIINYKILFVQNLCKVFISKCKSIPGIGNLVNDNLNYMHAEFEEKLFGHSDLNLVQLTKENISTVCFRNAVLVPNAYASVPFRCKMDGNTRWPKKNGHPLVVR